MKRYTSQPLSPRAPVSSWIAYEMHERMHAKVKASDRVKQVKAQPRISQAEALLLIKRKQASVTVAVPLTAEERAEEAREFGAAPATHVSKPVVSSSGYASKLSALKAA